MDVHDAPDETVESEDQSESPRDRAPRAATPVVFGASAIGPLHVENGIPCQDACAFSVLPSGLGAIAVADGLGSAPMSEVGATLAVQSAVHCVNDLFADSDTSQVPLEEMVRSAVCSARKTLELKSVEKQWALTNLACTMIVIAFKGDCLAVGHIGDGAVVGQTHDGLRLLSGPGESEYTNEVVPLTSNEWTESLRILPTVPGIQCVAAFTDGCQRAALRRSNDTLEPFEGFFAPIFSYARELPVAGEAEGEIRALLSSKKICDNSEDDKTLVIAVLG
jgi:hypothetical protein